MKGIHHVLEDLEPVALEDLASAETVGRSVGDDLALTFFEQVETRKRGNPIGRPQVREDQAVIFPAWVGRLAHTVLVRALLRLAWLLETPAGDVEEPSVIAAADSVGLDAAVIERGPSMAAVGVEQSEAPLFVAKENEILSEHANRLGETRRGGELGSDRYRLPIAPEELTRRGTGSDSSEPVVGSRRWPPIPASVDLDHLSRGSYNDRREPNQGGAMGAVVRFTSLVSLVFFIPVLAAEAVPPPSISRVIPDVAAEILFVHGENFGADPSVWLDGIPLHVLNATGSSIQAELPSLEPGTYLLIVARSRRMPPKPKDLATMDVTLGAVGPDGAVGPPGPEGPPGPPGETGAPGRDGNQWLTGDGPPPASLGNPGDLYLDEESGDVYRNDGAWTRVASLRGPAGPEGPGTLADPREEVAALLGIDASDVGVPLAAVTPAQCDSGAAVSLAGAAGEVIALFGEESISSPFAFRVALRSATSSPPASVGSDVTLQIANLSSATRRGIVTSSELGGTIADAAGGSIHVLTVEPALVRARSVSGFAAFEQQSISDIVERVLQEFGLVVSFSVVGGRHVEYEAQWNESSLDFVSRLLEREGIHYHVTDDGGIVVSDVNGVFGAGPVIPYEGHFADPGTAEIVSSFRVGGSSVPARVTVRGWDFKRKEVVTGEATFGGIGDIATYAADTTDVSGARSRAQAILGRERSSAAARTGTSNSPGVRAGKVITIAGAGSPFQGSYVVTQVRHVLKGTEGCFVYGNEFTAIPAEVPFRPELRTLVPRFPGTVTGIVTDNNDPDQLYRVKVRFPWFPAVESNWARAARPLSGPVFFVPEVGDEVLVAFEHGDITRPFVIGTLWNGEDKPPTSQ
jgi:type VI secretion system VgrG family protein